MLLNHGINQIASSIYIGLINGIATANDLRVGMISDEILTRIVVLRINGCSYQTIGIDNRRLTPCSSVKGFGKIQFSPITQYMGVTCEIRPLEITVPSQI